MAGIDLTLDTTPWSTALEQLGKRGLVAIARGINRTAASERTAMARAVAADMGLKVGTARDAIKVEKASANSLEARVIARGKRIPLIDFKARGRYPSLGKGAGVSYTMQGQRKTWRSAFIAIVGDGHKGVFFRVGRKRLPIKQAYGPSIARVFANLLPVGESRRAEVLTANVQHEMEFELSRLKA